MSDHYRQYRYKREAYRHSEFGPRILASHGLDVVLKSDHNVMNSRYRKDYICMPKMLFEVHALLLSSLRSPASFLLRPP
jgi:hypothetical protein